MRGLLRLAIAVTALAVPAVAVAGAGAPNQTRAITCGREQYKPAKIILSCADAGIWLDRLAWSRWTSTAAQATGRYNEIVCRPTCAAGHLVSRPVKVTLTQPQSCPGRGHPAFRHAAFSFPSGPPPSAYHRFTFVCPY